ncbi:hypothetical protein HY772_06850 [Candidatus Woesearchaeota archaeon]|nr:hypothetical protein [Candidatus Woesearchaeota archaeon]
MRQRMPHNFLALVLLLLSLIASAMQLSASDLSDYAMQDLAAGSNDTYEDRSLITLLPKLSWDNPNVIDPIGDAPDVLQDIAAVYIDDDENNVYFRINFSETGDSAEPFTRYVYILIDGKFGGKKRVAKNVHADIPWDLLIKLKNPDDLAMYNIRELVTTELHNFSSSPNARVMSFYVEKRFIKPVIPWRDVRFQVFTQDKATNRFGDGTAVFYLNNSTRIIPDISLMLESVESFAAAPEDDETETLVTALENGNMTLHLKGENRPLQYITHTVWAIPPWLLLLAGTMLVVFVCISIILSLVRKIAKRKEDSSADLRRRTAGRRRVSVKPVAGKRRRRVQTGVARRKKRAAKHAAQSSGKKKRDAGRRR